MIEKQNESQNQINRKINLFILLNKPLREFSILPKKKESTKNVICEKIPFSSHLLHRFEQKVVLRTEKCFQWKSSIEKVLNFIEKVFFFPVFLNMFAFNSFSGKSRCLTDLATRNQHIEVSNITKCRSSEWKLYPSSERCCSCEAFIAQAYVGR